MKLYQELAKACGAYNRCVTSGNAEWERKWKDQIDEMLEEFPSGSGFDNGTQIDLDASDDDKLMFTTAFHHMNDGGMYDGWTEHTVIVTGSLGMGFHVKVGGRDRNEIKDYISEQFHYALDRDVAVASPIPQATGKTW